MRSRRPSRTSSACARWKPSIGTSRARSPSSATTAARDRRLAAAGRPGDPEDAPPALAARARGRARRALAASSMTIAPDPSRRHSPSSTMSAPTLRRVARARGRAGARPARTTARPPGTRPGAAVTRSVALDPGPSLLGVLGRRAARRRAPRRPRSASRVARGCVAPLGGDEHVHARAGDDRLRRAARDHVDRPLARARPAAPASAARRSSRSAVTGAARGDRHGELAARRAPPRTPAPRPARSARAAARRRGRRARSVVPGRQVARARRRPPPPARAARRSAASRRALCVADSVPSTSASPSSTAARRRRRHATTRRRGAGAACSSISRAPRSDGAACRRPPWCSAIARRDREPVPAAAAARARARPSARRPAPAARGRRRRPRSARVRRRPRPAPAPMPAAVLGARWPTRFAHRLREPQRVGAAPTARPRGAGRGDARRPAPHAQLTARCRARRPAPSAPCARAYATRGA